jgi:hypothetical protein
MYFRFGCAVVLVVLIALAGTAVEKQNLALRRRLSHQHYRSEVLLEQQARLRLKAQQLGTPLRLLDSLENGTLELQRPEQPPAAASRQPTLLQWRATPTGD